MRARMNVINGSGAMLHFCHSRVVLPLVLKKMPMLILISGLPGTGKTTLARAYATAYRVVHLNSDVLREELGLRGQYLPEDKKKVYQALLHRTREALLAGKDVIVDSTFFKSALREPFVAIAAECAVPLHWVEIKAAEQVISERVSQPRTDSEADFQVYLKIKEEYEPIAAPHLVLWSDSMPLVKMVELLRRYVQPNRSLS